MSAEFVHFYLSIIYFVIVMKYLQEEEIVAKCKDKKTQWPISNLRIHINYSVLGE